MGTGVGHGQETGAAVQLGEVLVGELLAVDGLATSALCDGSTPVCRGTVKSFSPRSAAGPTHVATGEVTALQHELGDDAVELGALVAEALLAGAEGTEVLGRLGDYIVVELEVDAADLGWMRPNKSAGARCRTGPEGVC